MIRKSAFYFVEKQFKSLLTVEDYVIKIIKSYRFIQNFMRNSNLRFKIEFFQGGFFKFLKKSIRWFRTIKKSQEPLIIIPICKKIQIHHKKRNKKN